MDTIDGQKARREAWMVLSDLFLDQDLTGREVEIANRLRVLPFDSQTLEEILFEEVCPVCVQNLGRVAGVWDGFDPATLVAAIEARGRHRVPKWRAIWWRWRGRRLVPLWGRVRAALDNGRL